MNPNDFVHCCVMVIGAFGMNKNVSCEGLGGGGKSILKHLYLNVYAGVRQLNYQLACEIYMVRSLALSCVQVSVQTILYLLICKIYNICKSTKIYPY